MRWRMTVVLLSMLLWLGGCGSKSSTGNGKGPLPIAVAVAEPLRVGPGGKVTLRGGESRDPKGEALIFHWDQVTGNPSPVSFSANDTEASFAVQVTLQETGIYAFTLTVENERGQQSLPDTVKVMVEMFDGRQGTALLPGGEQMEMVWIEAGTFTMGSSKTDSYDENEYPQRQVTISKGFYLGRYEITQRQWQVIMGTQPWTGKSDVQENPNNPAVYISWYDTQRFIDKLNQTGEEPLYRLPTEAEWEYACRAETTTLWSFGNDVSLLESYAWYRNNTWSVGENYAHAVGTKLPNPWGLYDMHGNVREWCQDGWGPYPNRSQTDPTGPRASSSRVNRGGGVQDNAQYTRSASRGDLVPDNRNGNLGARLLRIK